ncbi:MAG: YdeI/OmpD-associated family protein, partial [Planctomycetota bacterium]
ALMKRLAHEAKPRLRIDGVVGGQPFHGAFQPTGEGRYYLIVSKKFRKAVGLEIGDRTEVSFSIADQNAVDVPRELQFALEADEALNQIWIHLTPGRRRGLAYRVASAKRSETRENRVDEVLETLRLMSRE